MAHYKFHNDCQLSVLTYEQVKRLDFVMDQTVPIHGRGNYPTLYVKLKELIRLVRYKLQKEHSIEIRDVRLNGGAASYVLAPENSHYNDLDLIFGTDLSNEDQFDVIRDVVLECLKEFYPKEETTTDNSKITESMPSSPANTSTSSSSTRRMRRGTTRSRALSCDSDNLNIQIFGSDDNEDDNEDDDDSGDEREETTTTTMNKESERQPLIDQAKEIEQKINVKTELEERDINVNIRGINEGQDSIEKAGERTSSMIESGEEQKSELTSRIAHNQYQAYQMPLSNCAIKEAYVHKMVKVNDDDRWSLISLGVQQSEPSCCGHQVNCLQVSPTQRNNNKQQVEQQQHISVSISNNKENQENHKISTNPPAIAALRLHHQPERYLHQQPPQPSHFQQKKQFPNSIELKFVDRMRRKFEFSVDSFQIILDSLIQFYDYAPQSTITSQKNLISTHPSSTMINTRPLVNKRRCSGRCISRSKGMDKLKVSRENHYNQQQQQKQSQDDHDQCLLNGSRSYYQLPPLEPANMPSISSVASSSGCSSSSSVVSSSSSSLSCDEDNEDLYCDAESASSSSSSTSSLLSSTTLPMLSSPDNLCSDGEQQLHHQAKISAKKQQTTNNTTTTLAQAEENSSSNNNKKNNNNSTSGQFSVKMRPMSLMTEKENVSLTSSSYSDIKASGECCAECFGLLGHHQSYENLTSNNLVASYGFETNNPTSCAVISENFYPTVIGRSEYGNFKEALYHLEKKLIATKSPEEIRGGGLLKYCNLLVKNYKPVNVYQIRTFERYMCSRFFIDFSDLNQQQAKLESYLANHFSDDPILKFDYLTILHNVVQRSTVCLMNHELRLTLNMIRELAYKLNEQQEQQQQQQQPQQPQQHLQSQQQQQLASQQQLQFHHQHLQQAQHSNHLNQAHHHHHHYYQQQKPVLIQSGVYRVKLVNYTLAKPIGN